MAQVYLDLPGDPVGIPVKIGRKRMQVLAKHWHFVMRSRQRWIADEELERKVGKRAVEHLAVIGIGTEQLERIAAAGIVQVSISSGETETPTSDPDWGWEARLLPWEYLLAAATWKYRTGSFVVVRHLAGGGGNRAMVTPGSSALFIQSAPGALRGEYQFGIEREVLTRHLEPDVGWNDLPDPTADLIRSATSSTDPHLIHVSGLDNFQGARLLDPEQTKVPPSSIRDGMYLRDASWDECQVDADVLAAALTAGAQKPAMVSFNLYNSSARTAAFAVARGAAAAVGFQDYVDDRLGEIFFANFYWYWRSSGWNLLRAFTEAMNELTEYSDKLAGTGIVLWSAQPLVGRNAPPPKPGLAAPVPAPVPIASVTPALFRPDIRPHQRLNYSLLHNGKKPLFDVFAIYKSHPGPVNGVSVEVELQIGSERFPYQRAFDMRHHVTDLAEEIGVGLTSDLARSLHESVRATLFTEVKVGAARVFSRTFPISLLPVDEWKDDGFNHIWLPSFVLPRDPAVLNVIVRAQRYLMALRDDAFAGFDGYQRLEGDEADEEAVDAQVRSIWYALEYDYPLNYINPPPTFTELSQRLRTPSDVLGGGRGTCIDLALLMASCLEYMDIKPAIFLLEGHAFPAYWATEDARKEFLAVRMDAPLEALPDNATPLPDPEQEQEMEQERSFAQKFAWEFDKSRYKEVFKAVESGDLVPLESTMLTNRGGFWDAIDEGVNNLRDPEDFYCMLDIQLARDYGVTPLPLVPEGRSLHERA